ncbi:MAG: cysteine desulfurase [Deltaproteobacteria bacterium]|nr:cysteine desulfurase [Deltaproteobacteria bacterium]
MAPPVYLDYNATTPLDPEVVEAMRPYLEEHFGNPASSHWYGIAPRKAVDNARVQVASLLGCSPSEVIFTSCGSESNNFAIKGITRMHQEKGRHIITSRIEHPAVLEVCAFLEENGFEISYLPVDEHGQVSVTHVEQAIRQDTVLISIMHANNEVGSIQPIADIARLAHERGIIMHSDAAQSLGKIPVNVLDLGVDLLSIAGHKLYAPKGVGALYVKETFKPARLIHGAGQEMGMRAGTENVLEIVGLGKACEIARRDLQSNIKYMQRLRDRLHSALRAEIEEIRLNGHPEKRLPNTLSLAFKGLEANRLLEEIGLDVAASAGAACHADTVEISHVLKAMGMEEQWAKGTLRFSTGRMTTADEIDRAVKAITKAVHALRVRQGRENEF